jgi:hypothetical protein
MDLFKKIGEFVEHAPALLDEGVDHAAASIEGTSVLPHRDVG